MILVRDCMKIIESCNLAPKCKQIKVLLDDDYYKRISYIFNGKEISIHWTYKGEFVSSSKEKILEKIFSEIESN